eukprot:tig00021617_g22927.t1
MARTSKSTKGDDPPPGRRSSARLKPESAKEESESEKEVPAAGRRRATPIKSKRASATSAAAAASPKVAKKRGRPPKAASASPTPKKAAADRSSDEEGSGSSSETAAEVAPAKKAAKAAKRAARKSPASTSAPAKVKAAAGRASGAARSRAKAADAAASKKAAKPATRKREGKGAGTKKEAPAPAATKKRGREEAAAGDGAGEAAAAGPSASSSSSSSAVAKGKEKAQHERAPGALREKPDRFRFVATEVLAVRPDPRASGDAFWLCIAADDVPLAAPALNVLWLDRRQEDPRSFAVSEGWGPSSIRAKSVFTAVRLEELRPGLLWRLPEAEEARILEAVEETRRALQARPPPQESDDEEDEDGDEEEGEKEDEEGEEEDEEEEGSSGEEYVRDTLLPMPGRPRPGPSRAPRRPGMGKGKKRRAAEEEEEEEEEAQEEGRRAARRPPAPRRRRPRQPRRRARKPKKQKGKGKEGEGEEEKEGAKPKARRKVADPADVPVIDQDPFTVKRAGPAGAGKGKKAASAASAGGAGSGGAGAGTGAEGACCATCACRELVRAALTDDRPLFKRLLENTEGVWTLCMQRGPDVMKSAIDYIIQTNNHELIKVLGAWFRKGPKDGEIKRAAAPITKFEPLDTGSYNVVATGYAPRRLKASRGGKEGNNAFADARVVSSLRRLLDQGYFLEALLEHPGTSVATVELFREELPFTADKIARNLHRAVRAGNFALASHLVRDLAKREDYGFNKVHACALQNEEEYQLPLRQMSVCKKPQDNDNVSPIHCAAINPEGRYLQKLLEACPGEIRREDARGLQVIHYAAACEGTGPLEWLLAHGLSGTETVNKLKVTPLMVAAFRGRLHNVALLVKEAAASVPAKDSAGRTALHYAAAAGHVECIGALAGPGLVPVDAQDRQGYTPLIRAAIGGRLEAVKALLEKKAGLDKKDKTGKTALTYAAKNGHAHVLSCLMRAGANIEAQDTSRNTPAHYAAAFGFRECVELLLNAGADPNALSDWKTTVTGAAMVKGHFGVVDYLLGREGIDFNVVNETGMSLLSQVVEEAGQKDETVLQQAVYLTERRETDVAVRDKRGFTAL